MQSDYAAKTGIKSLKLRHNNVIGYFIEVSAQNAPILQSPAHASDFIHRQTVADAMRFTTLELSSLEQRIAAAAERALAIEQDVFGKLCAEVEAASQTISRIAGALARLDVAAALAELAETRRYTAPAGRSIARLRDQGWPPSDGRAGAATQRRCCLHRQ